MNPQTLQSTKQQFRWKFRTQGKHILNMCTAFSFYSGLIIGLLATTSPVALANPTGGVVTGGSATITNAGSELQINQNSNRALIEWNSFNINAGETTRFIQPGASAIALNRVVNSQQVSAINGNLIANGHVLIINPNGVLIGPTGNVDTVGFIASTADISNDAFMNGGSIMNFDRAGRADAVVENQGSIYGR